MLRLMTLYKVYFASALNEISRLIFFLILLGQVNHFSRILTVEEEH